MRNDNDFQLAAYIITSLIIMIRAIFGFAYEHTQLSWLIPGIIITVTNITALILAIPVYKSFGWVVFNIVGTNTEMISE